MHVINLEVALWVTASTLCELFDAGAWPADNLESRYQCACGSFSSWARDMKIPRPACSLPRPYTEGSFG